jgi:hypothetical protein
MNRYVVTTHTFSLSEYSLPVLVKHVCTVFRSERITLCSNK